MDIAKILEEQSGIIRTQNEIIKKLSTILLESGQIETAEMESIREALKISDKY